MDIQSLLPWIEQSLRDNTNRLSQGYQGQVLLYDDGEQKIVIKTPHGRGLLKHIHTRLLRHEYAVYQRLAGMAYVPRCYGLIDNRYLAIEYIPAHTIRQQRPDNNSVFYSKLLDAIKQLHAREVGHMDLKRKENLLVDKNENPVLIDFGAAIIFKPGMHPLNHFLYRLACRFDYNAWIKHKYMGRLNQISDEDEIFYNRSWLERMSSGIKRFYLRLKSR